MLLYTSEKILGKLWPKKYWQNACKRELFHRSPLMLLMATNVKCKKNDGADVLWAHLVPPEMDSGPGDCMTSWSAPWQPSFHPCPQTLGFYNWSEREPEQTQEHEYLKSFSSHSVHYDHDCLRIFNNKLHIHKNMTEQYVCQHIRN